MGGCPKAEGVCRWGGGEGWGRHAGLLLKGEGSRGLVRVGPALPPPPPKWCEFLEAPKKVFDWPKAWKKIWPNLLRGGGVVGGWCAPPPRKWCRVC